MAIQYGGRMANERPDSNLNPDLSKQGLFQDAEAATTEKTSESTGQTSSVTSGQTSVGIHAGIEATIQESDEEDDFVLKGFDYDEYDYNESDYKFDFEENSDDSVGVTDNTESSGGKTNDISTESFLKENADLIKKVKNILDFVYPDTKVTLAELLAGAEGYISKYGTKKDRQESNKPAQLTDSDIKAFASIFNAFIESI